MTRDSKTTRNMERYTCVGDAATVKAVRDLLSDLIAQGFGDDLCVIWSDDEQTFMPVEGMLYARRDRQVQILPSED